MPNWNEVLREIQRESARSTSPLDSVRRRYLKKLHNHTRRNIIAYYSGFLSKPGIALLDINDEDKNGFMMSVHKLDRSLGLDLIIHTPGGNIAATQSIVHYLHQMFPGDIRAVVPQIAMSAGTMIACSCRKILMGKQSNLGPIDPHLQDIPAKGVKSEFEKALEEYKRDPDTLMLWREIIRQYRPTFLSQCENAIDWSKSFVQAQLEIVMFQDRPDAREKARKIVEKLTDYSGNKTHERHIHADECSAMGLDVEMMEENDTLQDLILTVHHCFMHTLMNTPAFKIIENHLGIAIVKQRSS